MCFLVYACGLTCVNGRSRDPRPPSRLRVWIAQSCRVAGHCGACSRGVTIYLLPGLTGRQRRAVIRRLRQEASRGCGPELPLAQLLLALLLDRVRGALGLAAAAVRLHPGTTLLPAAFVATVMTLFVLVSAGLGPVLGRASGAGGGPVGRRARVDRPQAPAPARPVAAGPARRGRDGSGRYPAERRQAGQHRAERHRAGRPGTGLGAARPRRAALGRAAAGGAGLLRRDAGGGRDPESAGLPPHVQLVGFSLGSVAT